MTHDECDCGETMEGYHIGDCSIFDKTQMTYDELLAMIEQYQNYTTESAILISALRAVVELKERIIPELITRIDVQEREYTNGYNQALADMKQAIEKEVK